MAERHDELSYRPRARHPELLASGRSAQLPDRPKADYEDGCGNAIQYQRRRPYRAGWAPLGRLELSLSGHAKEVLNNVPSMHGLHTWRRIVGELFTLTDLRQLNYQILRRAPTAAST